MAPTPTLIPAITPAVAAVAAASTTHFDPKTQIFYIAGPDGIASIPIAMSVIDLQRVRLASICISYGVQLGLCLMTLVMLLLLIPLSKLRKPINALNMLSLVTALVRLCLLVGYFPGPLSEYYVAWTRDARALQRTDYSTNTAGNASNVLQFTLIEISLILQTWKLMATWSDLWQWIIKSVSVGIAVATIVVKSLWCVHHTDMLRDRTLPLGLDVVGEVATIMGAASIFYFCGIFFANLMMHLDLTRGVLRRPRRGLSSLEILAIGHGTLMFLPTIFAGLDVAAGVRGAKLLPFDADSWVMTLVVIGLPLIGLVARYRAPSAEPSPSRRVSAFATGPMGHPDQGLSLKPHISQATTLGSPVAESFRVSSEVGGAKIAGVRGRERGGSRPTISTLGGTEEYDLGSGIQIRRDVVVSYEGRKTSQWWESVEEIEQSPHAL